WPVAGPTELGSATTVEWECLARVGVRPANCPTAANSVRGAASAAVNAPAAPENLAATVSGSTVTLSWIRAGGEAPTSYVVEAGSSPALANLAAFDTGSAQTLLTVQNVPAGAYFVRVRARNSVGTSGPSNEILVTVAGRSCTGPPAAPSQLISNVSGSSVTLNWAAPGSGCAPTGYLIQAGSAPSLSNLANVNTGSSATTFSATGVGAGTYYVRVRALNGEAQSIPSNEVTVIVGSGPPMPGGTGQVMFWTDKNLGRLEVKVNGIVAGTITQYYTSSTPACRAPGAVTV